MVQTRIHRISAPLKTMLPRPIWRWLRAIATAAITPIRFSVQTGHLKSSIHSRAVSASGDPLPWYSYPAINFLQQRDFTAKSVLEFGGGQSTFWWAGQASAVCTIEEDLEWYNKIKSYAPSNVILKYAPIEEVDPHLNKIRKFLSETQSSKFDVVVVDGHNRYQATKIALEWLNTGGVIILDDSAGYGFYEVTQGLGLRRTDFFDFAPGVNLPKCINNFADGH